MGQHWPLQRLDTLPKLEGTRRNGCISHALQWHKAAISRDLYCEQARVADLKLATCISGEPKSVSPSRRLKKIDANLGRSERRKTANNGTPITLVSATMGHADRKPPASMRMPDPAKARPVSEEQISSLQCSAKARCRYEKRQAGVAHAGPRSSQRGQYPASTALTV